MSGHANLSGKKSGANYEVSLPTENGCQKFRRLFGFMLPITIKDKQHIGGVGRRRLKAGDYGFTIATVGDMIYHQSPGGSCQNL